MEKSLFNKHFSYLACTLSWNMSGLTKREYIFAQQKTWKIRNDN